MAAVTLPCGHAVDVDHTMGERLVVCADPAHETPAAHVVTASHAGNVTYTAGPWAAPGGQA